MKSERRHELQTNTLADNLGNTIEQHGDRIKLIGAAAIALLALIFAVLFITGQQTARQARHWTNYFAAISSSDPQTGLEIAAGYFDENKLEDTVASQWTSQSLADFQLGRGTMDRFRNRESAVKELESAKTNFQKIADSTKASKFIRTRALFGLAQVHESLCEPKEAKERYQKVIDLAGKEAAIAKASETAIKRIDDLQAQGWFVWFKDKEITPPEPVNPNLPASLEDLPGRPNLEFGIPESLSTDLDEPIDDGSKDDPAKEGDAPKDGDAKKGDTPEGGGATTTPTKDDDGPAPAKDGEADAKKPENGATPEKPAEPTSDSDKPGADKPAADKADANKTGDDKPEAKTGDQDIP